MTRRDFSLQQLKRDNAWLISHLLQSGTYIGGLLPKEVKRNNILNLDLSKDNPEVLAAKSPRDLLGYIRARLSASGALFAISAHGERRMHPSLGKEMTHLGLDIWSAEDFSVVAPINGVLYTVQGDGTGQEFRIVLQHRLGMFRFYTVYSHISNAMWTARKPGSLMQAGDLIGYPVPSMCHHATGLSQFHFMVVLEAKEEPFEVSEYAETKYEPYFLALCPDPSSLLRSPEPALKQRRILEPLRINPVTNHPYRSSQTQKFCRIVSNMKRFY